MRLIGILLALAVLGYTTYIYLGSAGQGTTAAEQTKPAEYVDQAKQASDAINKAMEQHKDQLDGAN